MKKWAGILFLIVTIIGFSIELIREKKETFLEECNTEAAYLISGKTPSETIITNEDLANLPEPVKKYLRYAGVVGKKRTSVVRLKQVGFFRMAPDKEYEAISARQYYSVNDPGFVWIVKMDMYPLISIYGRDRYTGGNGDMKISVAGAIPVVEANGPEIDQGTLLRFLNEMVWFPDAFLADYVSWEGISDSTAKATITLNNLSASAILTFNQKGEATLFEAMRYRTLDDGSYKLDKWVTPYRDYKNMNGFKIPTAGEGIWMLDSGEFEYVKLKITEIDYNIKEIYN